MDDRPTLNVARLNELADFIERLPKVPTRFFAGEAYTSYYDMAKDCEPGDDPIKAFSMSSYQTDLFNPSGMECGSACCLAGWTVFNYASDDVFYISRFMGGKRPKEGWLALGADLLGLTVWQAIDLFNPDRNLTRITPLEAATALRILANTGDVDWAKARKTVKAIKAAEKAMGASV